MYSIQENSALSVQEALPFGRIKIKCLYELDWFN